MKTLWLLWGVPLLHLALGVAAAQVVTRMSTGWPLGWRFLFLVVAILAMALLFIWTIRMRDRRLAADRTAAIDRVLSSLGTAGNATLIQAATRIRDGQSKEQVLAWLRGIGVPAPILEDIYRRGHATAHPPFLRTQLPATVADRAWPLLLLASACALAFGFLVNSTLWMLAGGLGWFASQELSERAWKRAGNP